MLDWDFLSEKIETALSVAPQTPSFFDILGMTNSGVGNLKMASKIATAAIRDDVDSYIASIPRVPTNRYDAAMAFGLIGLFAGGLYVAYKVMMNEPSFESPSSTK